MALSAPAVTLPAATATLVASGAKKVGDVIPSLILNLVIHDGRRGYDARADAEAINAAAQKAVDDAAKDRLVNETDTLDEEA